MKHRIVTAAQMKEIEQAGDAHGLPYLQMMENAGLAAYAELQKQLLAPSGVFDMDGFHCAVHIYMGNKTVGAVKKNAVHDLSVFQCLLHFHFCLIRLCQNHWLHAKNRLLQASTTGRSPFISYSFVIHRPCRLQ